MLTFRVEERNTFTYRTCQNENTSTQTKANERIISPRVRKSKQKKIIDYDYIFFCIGFISTETNYKTDSSAFFPMCINQLIFKRMCACMCSNIFILGIAFFVTCLRTHFWLKTFFFSSIILYVISIHSHTHTQSLHLCNRTIKLEVKAMNAND